MSENFKFPITRKDEKKSKKIFIFSYSFIYLPLHIFVTTHKHRLYIPLFVLTLFNFSIAIKSCVLSLVLSAVTVWKINSILFCYNFFCCCYSAHSLTSLSSNLQTIHFHLLLFCPFSFLIFWDFHLSKLPKLYLFQSI